MKLLSEFSSAPVKSGSMRKSSYIFEDIDPTIIIRLHSILCDKDLFILNNDEDYSITRLKPNLISMKLPIDMQKALIDLDEESIWAVANIWHSSIEVKLCKWPLQKCIDNITAFKKLSAMHPFKKVIFLEFPETVSLV